MIVNEKGVKAFFKNIIKKYLIKKIYQTLMKSRYLITTSEENFMSIFIK